MQNVGITEFNARFKPKLIQALI